MSLLDDNFDVDPIFILKNKIEKYIKNNVMRYADPQQFEIDFVQCNWNKIISDLDKYYIYTYATYSTLHVRIDRISKSLPGGFGGPDGEYILIHRNSLKTIL